MKVIVLILAFLISVSSMSYAWNNDNGKNYQEGYKEGYTYNEGGIKEIAPIPPIPPIPNIGESSQDAYTRGILDGRREREERRY